MVRSKCFGTMDKVCAGVAVLTLHLDACGSSADSSSQDGANSVTVGTDSFLQPGFYQFTFGATALAGSSCSNCQEQSLVPTNCEISGSVDEGYELLFAGAQSPIALTVEGSTASFSSTCVNPHTDMSDECIETIVSLIAFSVSEMTGSWTYTYSEAPESMANTGQTCNPSCTCIYPGTIRRPGATSLMQ